MKLLIPLILLLVLTGCSTHSVKLGKKCTKLAEDNTYEKSFVWIINNENLEKIVAPPSFIKLAMRNMVRKGSKSISHFSITFLVLIGILILVATLGKPNIPI